MESNILEQIVGNILISIPTIQVGIEPKKYVLITISSNRITPIKFSDNVNALQTYLEMTLSRSLFAYKHLGSYKHTIPELGLVYDIVETESLF